jgi:hypothetical protein
MKSGKIAARETFIKPSSGYLNYFVIDAEITSTSASI